VNIFLFSKHIYKIKLRKGEMIMGILKDILDTAHDLGVETNAEEYLKKRKYTSISKRATEGTLQFPVLVSRSLDVETLQMITKALERLYASFTQIVLTMRPILNIEKQKDPVGYLRQFHQNSDVKTDLNDIGNMLGDIEENYTCMTNADETMYILSAIYEGTTGNIVADNKEQLMSIYDFLKSDKLNDKFIPAKEATYRFKDADKSAHFNSIPVAEATRGDLNRVNRSIRQLSDPNAPAPNGNGIRAITALNQASSISSKIDSDMKAEAAKVQDRQDKLDQNAINNQLAHEQLDQNKDQFDQNMDQRKAEFEHQKQMDSIRNKPKLKDLDVKLADNVLKDNDVKKSNELVPTTLHIRVKTVNNKGEDVGFLDFIVGVKSTMHPIKSDEMVINMVSACKNNNKFFDFIKRDEAYPTDGGTVDDSLMGDCKQFSDLH
jgi:hypothetical protein